MEDKLLYRDEVYAIQGAIFDVYKEMGNAWHEEVYQQCLERELKMRGIPFEAKKELAIFYKGQPIEKKYVPDVFCYGKIILELKARGRTSRPVAELPSHHQVQARVAYQLWRLSPHRNPAIRALTHYATRQRTATDFRVVSC